MIVISFLLLCEDMNTISNKFGRIKNTLNLYIFIIIIRSDTMNIILCALGWPRSGGMMEVNFRLYMKLVDQRRWD